jgi:GDPmannose 4,6-dehydratase
LGLFIHLIIQKNKKLDKLVVGNLNVKRDLGYAAKHIETIWKMLQFDKADDFTICSGGSISLRGIAQIIINDKE